MLYYTYKCQHIFAKHPIRYINESTIQFGQRILIYQSISTKNEEKYIGKKGSHITVQLRKLFIILPFVQGTFCTNFYFLHYLSKYLLILIT